MKKIGSHPRGGMKKMQPGPMLPGKGRVTPMVSTAPIPGAPHSASAKHGASSVMGRGARSNVKGY